MAENLNKPIFPILMDDIKLDQHKDSGVLFTIASYFLELSKKDLIQELAVIDLP